MDPLERDPRQQEVRGDAAQERGPPSERPTVS